MAGSSWGQISAGYDEKVKMSDSIEFVDTDKLKKYKPFRAVGQVYTYRQIWFPIYKDGKPVIKPNGQPLQIPKIVTNFDGAKQAHTDAVCPYQELMKKMGKHLDPKKSPYESPVFLTNVINRTLQEDMPEKITPPTKSEVKSGFRDIESKHRNPVQVLNVNSSNNFKKIKDTMELNTVKLKSGDRVTKEPSDPKYGYDIQIKFDPDAKVKSDKFLVQKGERTPLEEHETEYLLWDIQGAIDAQVDDEEAAKKEADRLWAEFSKSLKKGKSNSDDEDEDGPTDLEDDEDEKPKKKKKLIVEDDDEEEVKPKNKKKAVVDDDDEEEEVKPAKKAKKRLDDDDEDEEEVKPKKKAKKPPVDDDEDEDEEEVKPKKKKKAVEEDDEDEEEVKPKKKAKKVVDDDEDEEEVKPKKKVKKPADDEDDEDSIIGLDEDDED